MLLLFFMLFIHQKSVQIKKSIWQAQQRQIKMKESLNNKSSKH